VAAILAAIWILKKPSQWQVATQPKFHPNTNIYQKIQKNDVKQILQGSRTEPPD
jgi:hypothetical protein